MVSKEEIYHIAKLMRIQLDDHTVHIDRIQKMIEYFVILDEADIQEEDIISSELPLTELRRDEHIPFDENLIKYLKSYKKKYIRAPKMF